MCQLTQLWPWLSTMQLHPTCEPFTTPRGYPSMPDQHLSPGASHLASQGADVTASTVLARCISEVVWTRKDVLQALRVQHYLQVAHVDSALLIGCLVASACEDNIQLGRVEEVLYGSIVLDRIVVRTETFTKPVGKLCKTVPGSVPEDNEIGPRAGAVLKRCQLYRLRLLQGDVL